MAGSVLPDRPAGDGEAATRFEALYRAQAPEVIAYVARRVPTDVASDVVAETFAVAWRKLDRVPDHPLPWLLGVARRVAANQRRSDRRREAVAGRAAAWHGALTQPEPGSELSDVLRSFRELPEPDQEVLRLAAWEGLSTADGARVLGCTALAYRLRLHRARRKLSAKLDELSADTPPLIPTLSSKELSDG